MKSAPFVVLAFSLIGLLIDSDISRICGALAALGAVYWIHCRDLHQTIEHELNRSYKYAGKTAHYPPVCHQQYWSSRIRENGFSFNGSAESRSRDSSPVAVPAL